MSRQTLVTIRLSTDQALQLGRLQRLGYGEGEIEVAEYLIAREIDDLIRAGVLPRA